MSSMSYAYNVFSGLVFSEDKVGCSGLMVQKSQYSYDIKGRGGRGAIKKFHVCPLPLGHHIVSIS